MQLTESFQPVWARIKMVGCTGFSFYSCIRGHINKNYNLHGAFTF